MTDNSLDRIRASMRKRLPRTDRDEVPRFTLEMRGDGCVVFDSMQPKHWFFNFNTYLPQCVAESLVREMNKLSVVRPVTREALMVALGNGSLIDLFGIDDPVPMWTEEDIIAALVRLGVAKE